MTTSKQNKAKADSELIYWLLNESGMTRYQISEASGVAQSTLSRIASYETHIDKMSFGVARKLTAVARQLQDQGLDLHNEK